jgi:hypothetical protein
VPTTTCRFAEIQSLKSRLVTWFLPTLALSLTVNCHFKCILQTPLKASWRMIVPKYDSIQNQKLLSISFALFFRTVTIF